LATPELDHDALREILSLFSTTVRDEGYSPSPTETGYLVLSSPRKEVYTSTSSVTRRPRLSSCSEPCPRLLTAKTRFLLIFCLNFRIKVSSLLFSEECFLYSAISQIFLCPQITSFLAFLKKVAWVQIPIRSQAWNPYKWVPFPISSLTLEDGLPTTSLTGNSFMGQRTVEKLLLIGTGRVRVISTILGFLAPSIS
jgi:hypothetical protein